MSKIDVLNLAYRSYPTRDTEAEILVANYLRLQGISVAFGSMHNGFWELLCHRPKVLMLANTIGASYNLLVGKFAKFLGIKVVSLTAEGIYNSLETRERFWGWNTEQQLCEDLLLQWNENSKNKLLKFIPEQAPHVKVCGYAGSDRYQIVEPKPLRNLKSQRYDLVVGVGCWFFNLRQENEKEPSGYPFNVVEFFKKDRDLFAEVLSRVIESNPNVLFILKEHPASESAYSSGIDKCLDFHNIYRTKFDPLLDCLHASDFWISYESTTALEAWVLGKQTALINPSGTDFPINRMPIYAGQPNYPDVETFQVAIDSFLETGKLPGFAELSFQRDESIKENFQWADGLNHVRVGNAIIDLIGQPSKELNQWDLKYFLKHIINNTFRWYVGPYYRFFPKWGTWLTGLESFYHKYRKNWDSGFFERFAAQRLEEQLEFYKSKNLGVSALRKIVGF